MSNPNPVLQKLALRLVGNMLIGNDLQVQVIVDNDALPCLRSLLSSPDQAIREDACRVIRNITVTCRTPIFSQYCMSNYV